MIRKLKSKSCQEYLPRATVVVVTVVVCIVVVSTGVVVGATVDSGLKPGINKAKMLTRIRQVKNVLEYVCKHVTIYLCFK